MERTFREPSRHWSRVIAVVVLAWSPSLGAFAQGSPAQPLRVAAVNIADFFDFSGPEPTGLEYKLLEYYSKLIGRTMQIERVASVAELLSTIEAGGAEIGAATVAVTANRKKEFDFGGAYFPSQTRLWTTRSRPVAELGDLRGMKVGTSAGSVLEEQLAAVCDCQIVPFPPGSIGRVFEKVRSGELAAMCYGTDTVLAWLRSSGADDLWTGPAISEPVDLAFVLPKGSPHREPLDTLVEQLKTSGIYFRLLREQFGDSSVDIVLAGRGKLEAGSR